MEGDRHITISITTGTVVKVLLLIILAFLLYMLRDIVLDVLTAIVIASAVEPAIALLRRHKFPRTLAVIVTYVIMLGGFFAVFYFFLPILLSDIATFISALPAYLDNLNQSGGFNHYAQVLGLPAPNISIASLVQGVQGVLNLGAFDNALTAASAIFGGVFSFILILVFSFYFAVLETGVDDFLRIIIPRKNQPYVIGLWKRSQHKIGLWMQGQLLLAVIMGMLVFLGLTILGVPHALVLAVIAGCFEIIPVFGPTLSAIPAVAVAFVGGGFTLFLLTVALYVIAQQFENHLIYPLVVTRVVGVPPLLVILALIIGGELAGFLGIILSVPVAATIREFVRDIEAGRAEAAKTIK